MSTETTTFVNPLGEVLAPLLMAIRRTGFFEIYVYFPAMVVISIFLFIHLRRKMLVNGTFDLPIRHRFRKLAYPLYYMMCFFVSGALAVAFKTMILEETDYTEPHWYIPYVSYLHFYITSVALAYVYVIYTNRSDWLNGALCAYIQVGFLGAYWIGGYRIVNEEWVLSDPASGLSGFYMFFIYGILNIDIALRFFSPTKPVDRQHTIPLMDDVNA